MKNLKGFLNEDEDKKKKPKPKSEASKSASKKKTRKEEKGKDDQQYIQLMEEYKRMRHHSRLESEALHHKALHLRHHGDVSMKAITAGAYI